MSDSASSPFTESKSNPWVWIGPSMILHVVVLVIWLSMPEPENVQRDPEQRDLPMTSKQAEELQDMVEESNLEALQRDVSELQQIKQRMADIRAQRLRELERFERTMDTAAPQDVAVHLADIEEIHGEIRDLVQDLKPKAEEMSKRSPQVLETIQTNPAEAFDAIQNLADLQNNFSGASWDLLEERLADTKGVFQSLEASTEWITDPEILAQLDAMHSSHEAVMQSLRPMRNQFWGNFGGKRLRFRGELFEPPEENRKTLVAFKTMMDSEETAQRKQELEQTIQKKENSLPDLKKQVEELKDKLASVPKNKENRRESKTIQNEMNGLSKTIKQLSRDIDRDKKKLNNQGYLPDGELAKNGIRLIGRMKHIVSGKYDSEPVQKFLDQQAEFLKTAASLRQTLEAM